jgi:hypothetical protein
MGEQVKICLMEMDDRTKQSVSLVFRHRADGAIMLTDENEADIAVLDLDLENSLNNYQAIRGSKPTFQAIGLSSRPEMECGEILVLPKPISAGRLLEAVQKMSGGKLKMPGIKASGAASSLSARIGTSRRRPETVAAKASDRMVFDPDAYLLGTILSAAEEAEKQDAVAVISFYGDRIILVDHHSRLIHTNLSSSQARAFALSAIGADESVGLASTVGLQRPAVEYMARDQARRRFAGKTYSVPREVFMWKLGAMTSRGRLPLGVGAEERVYLRRWPNMTGFSYADNEMRVIAYWARQAASLSEIAEALGVAEQEVFTIFAAAYAAGLAGKARREVDGVWEAPEVLEHKQRGLFSSIMRRLVQRRPVVNEEAAA